MKEGKWTAGVDIGAEIIQVSYMTEGMKEPVTIDRLFPVGEELSCLRECLMEIPGLKEPGELSCLELSLSEFTPEKAEAVRQACLDMGVARSAVHLQSREEASIYFAMSQEEALWRNETVFFDFSKEGMLCRRLQVERNSNGSMTAVLTCERLESMDFENPSDEEFLRLSQERLEHRLVSAVYLVGEGFYREEWAVQTLPYLCGRRRVFKGLNLYTRGASYAAYDRIHQHAFGQVLFRCRNCIQASVGLRILHRGEQRLLYLVREGTNWYEARALIEAIPDGISAITAVIQSGREEREEEIPLEQFPKRERRMTRLEISLGFLDEACGVFTVRDLGFGSLAAASDTVVRKDIRI